ncbi:hypothetical protein V2J09_010512 [Rumex salicifolius]
MGFDIRKAISRFSSSKCQAQQEEQAKCKMATPKPKVNLSNSTPMTVKREKKISSITPPRRSKRREGKISTITKSVKFEDCKCNRNVKVSPLGAGNSSISTTTSKSLTSSLANSSSDTKRRNLEVNSTTISSTEDTIKTTGSSLGLVPNENPTNPQVRLPVPIGVHSRNLSYGTIYNASKKNKSKEEPSVTKDDRHDSSLIIDKSDGDCGDLKLGRSMRHTFGLGGCNYGHGSIINGLKSLKKDQDFAQKDEDSVMGKKSSCLDGASVEEIKNAGTREYKKGLYENAISFYDKAIALNPQNASCHNNKAAALSNLGRITEAVEECLKAVNCNPSYIRAHYRLGNLYTRMGQVDEAKRHFKLSGHGQCSDAVQRMLTVEASLTKLRKALKAKDWEWLLMECSKTIKAGADSSEEVLTAKAEALLNLNRANEALEVLMDAKKISAKSSSKLLLLQIELYFYLGRFEEAAQTAEEAVYMEFNKKSLMQLKKAWGAADSHGAGNEYYKLGKYCEACAMYGQALQYVPSNCVLLCKQASCRFKLGQWERTIEDCNAALKSHPNYSEAIFQRAQAHAKLGHWEEAQRDYLLLGKQTQVESSVSKSVHEAGTKGAKKGCQQLTKN